MKLLILSIVIALFGCLDQQTPGPTVQPERWHPTPVMIDCGPLPETPEWTATLDEKVGTATIPLDRWLDLSDWIASIDNWRSCMATKQPHG